MKGWWILAIGAAAGMASAQSREILYAPGHAMTDQGIHLKSWGSGTIKETDEVALEGTNSIRVTSRNYFQGGLMNFSKPIDLSGDFADKNVLLEIKYRSADEAVIGPNPTTPGVPGAQPGRGGAPGGGFGGGAGGGGNDGGGLLFVSPGGSPFTGMALGFQRGGGRGGGGLGGGGGAAAGAPPGQGVTAANQAIRRFKNLRIIVWTTDGLKSELYLPVSNSFSTDRGWRATAFPLSAINGFARTNKIVQGLAFGADTSATFYIGSLRMVSDTTPITATVNIDSLNLAQGDRVKLEARGYAGSTILAYEWSFDSEHSTQIDATGPFIEHTFNKPGHFKVQVKVRDQYDAKTPIVKTIDVVVNP